MTTIDQVIGSPLNWDDFLQRTKEHDRKHSEKRPEPQKKMIQVVENVFPMIQTWEKKNNKS